MVQKEDVLTVMAGRFLDFYLDFTPLHQVADEWRGPCPLHGGEGPNFSINPVSGRWHCYSRCQETGDVFGFIQKRYTANFPEALRQVAEWAGFGFVDGIDTTVKSTARPQAPGKERQRPTLNTEDMHKAHKALMDDPFFLSWLADHRGLTKETLVRFQVGLLPPDVEGARRISFPIYDAGGHLTNIRRHLFAYCDGLDRSKKTLPWRTGLGADLYPISMLSDTGDVLLVEGEADALLANQMGFIAVTGTLGAGNWKAHWTEHLRGRAVVILYDADGSGQGGARYKAAPALAEAGCAVSLATIPEGKGKDLTEWMVGYGGTAEDVRNAIRSAEPYLPEPSPSSQESLDQTSSSSRRGVTGTMHAAGAALSDDVSPTGAATVSVPVEAWPKAAPEMFHGLAGEIVRTIEPHTEADSVALLVQILAAFGSAIGRSAHFAVEADCHYGNLFVVLVGASSKGRKGTSWGQVRRLMEVAEHDWEVSCVQSGLSTGEGLIWHVRDAIEKPIRNKETEEVEMETVDPGVADKRLLVMESEYAAVLRLAGREGNNLSAILRDAWDRGRLQTMTKNSPVKSTGAHVSLIGHVTADELRRELSSTEAGNGFANRFLWICARRSKELPEGGSLTDEDLCPLAERLSAAIRNARQAGIMARDEAARGLWHAVYHNLSEAGAGLSGSVTSRSEAQVMRLALLYALLDSADAIRLDHLQAALGVWEYVEESARYVFGDSMGDPIADDILRALRNSPDGLSRNEIRELFQRHQSSGRIGQALALLLQHGRTRVVKQAETGGRPAERWYAATPYSRPA